MADCLINMGRGRATANVDLVSLIVAHLSLSDFVRLSKLHRESFALYIWMQNLLNRSCQETKYFVLIAKEAY